MPKPMYVWTGTAWVSVASEVESLATYATQSYADNQPGMKLIVPSSVAVGSGSGSIATQGTVTFSGASSVSLNDVFSSTYTNYRIIINGVGTVDTYIAMRARVSGSDNTSSVYGVVRWNYRAGATSATGTRTDTSWALGAVGTSRQGSIIMDIFNPFATANTSLTSAATSDNGTYTFGDNCAGTLDVTTSYTGFTIFPTSGNITGTIRVYGYKAG